MGCGHTKQAVPPCEQSSGEHLSPSEVAELEAQELRNGIRRAPPRAAATATRHSLDQHLQQQQASEEGEQEDVQPTMPGLSQKRISKILQWIADVEANRNCLDDLESPRAVTPCLAGFTSGSSDDSGRSSQMSIVLERRDNPLLAEHVLGQQLLDDSSGSGSRGLSLIPSLSSFAGDRLSRCSSARSADAMALERSGSRVRASAAPGSEQQGSQQQQQRSVVRSIGWFTVRGDLEEERAVRSAGDDGARRHIGDESGGGRASRRHRAQTHGRPMGVHHSGDRGGPSAEQRTGADGPLDPYGMGGFDVVEVACVESSVFYGAGPPG
eukprot:TRINITY_DN11130_c0_g1_i1.p1 TRINITY_DN11130_c0_g1~~TRINITY_DN11130_c0_g1_i1.p1  ORF type:complete len:325 (+),score=49.30 TRINITY_DN11130_c0_g1_i1:218-1192(+)